MPVKDEAKRALVAARVLEDSLIKYLNDSYPLHKLATDIQEAERANGELLYAILRIHGLKSTVLRDDTDGRDFY